MPVRFNPIACGDWLDGGGELEAAGVPIGRVQRDALRCSFCGRTYALIVQLSVTDQEVLASKRHFEKIVSDACGNHMPIVQLGS